VAEVVEDERGSAVEGAEREGHHTVAPLCADGADPLVVEEGGPFARRAAGVAGDEFAADREVLHIGVKRAGVRAVDPCGMSDAGAARAVDGAQRRAERDEARDVAVTGVGGQVRPQRHVAEVGAADDAAGAVADEHDLLRAGGLQGVLHGPVHAREHQAVVDEPAHQPGQAVNIGDEHASAGDVAEHARTGSVVAPV